MPRDVFVISSSDSDDSLPPVTFATKKYVPPSRPSPEKVAKSTPKSVLIHTNLSSDEDEILPLFERIARKTVIPKSTDVLPLEDFKLSTTSTETRCEVELPPKVTLVSQRAKPLYELSSSEEDLPDLNDFGPGQKLSASSDAHEAVEEAPMAKPKKNPTSRSGKSNSEIAAMREEVRRQREEKAATLQREKILKQIQMQKQRCLKPGECIKFLKAIADLTLLEMPEAAEIPRVFDEAGIQYAWNEQDVPRSITWVRQVDHSVVNCNNEVDTVTGEEEEKQAVVLLPVKDFLAAVHQFKQVQIGEGEGGTLHDIVQQFKARMRGKAITFLTCGIEKYFRQQRSKEQREYRTNITEDVPGAMQGKPKRARKQKELDVTVSRVDVEEALVDLQIRELCNVRLLDTPAEVAQVVASFTKAIAEAPFKQSKEDGGTFSWMVSGDTGQTVKVEKNGAGLLLLWQRQIEQFHMVSSDVAQAIVAKYSSPTALINAYSRCNNQKEGERLLQDIVVRRGVGPLATTRRIGPELSRKLFILLTSTDGSQVLDTS